jgi:hypothetical protein
MFPRSAKHLPSFVSPVPFLASALRSRTQGSMKYARFLVIGLATLIILAGEAHAQREPTLLAGGNGGATFSLNCPPNMILIGLRGREGNFVDQVRGVCSHYNVAGQRVGNTALTDPAGSNTGGIEWQLICDGQTALTSIGGRAGFIVDELFRGCKTVAPSGLATTPTFAGGGTVGGSNSSAQVFNLPCPNDKFADRIVGRAGDLVDKIGLSCIPAPLAATAIQQLTLGRPSAISGTSITGTVTLNGYARNAINVLLNTAGAPGAAVPASITVPENSRSAQFNLTSNPNTAGCPLVNATALNTNRIARAVFTPPPPANAGYTFSLVNPPPGLRYFLNTPVPGRICFSGKCSTPSNGFGNVSFTSNAPGTLSVPASVSFNILASAVDVNMTSGSSPGCAIVTSTLAGVTIRKVVLVDALPQ